MEQSNYLPFGKEWEAEISKMKKADIIAMLKIALLVNAENADENTETGLYLHKLEIGCFKGADASYEFVLTPEWAEFADGCTFFHSEGHGRYHDVYVTIDETDFANGKPILERDMPVPCDGLSEYLFIYQKGDEYGTPIEDAINWKTAIGDYPSTRDNIALDWLKAAIERGEFSKVKF